MKILIVEDEASIAEVLLAYCANSGFDSHLITNGGEVVEYVQHHRVDLVLLDVMLPDVDGFEICKSLRRFSKLPVIMVTAKSEEIDRLFGLEFGADDYICKPFSPREVIARIKAVLRRFHETDVRHDEQDSIVHSGLEIFPMQYFAKFKGSRLDLTPVEFKILTLMVKNVGRVYTRDEIMSSVYSDKLDVSDRNIDTHIKNIRKKIHVVSELSNPIASVYGVGYKCK